MPKNFTATQKFTGAAQYCKGKGKSKPNPQPIDHRRKYIVFRSKSFGAPQHNTVYHDKRDKQAQAFITTMANKPA